MLIKAKSSIIMDNGKNGINVRKDTNFCAWGQKKILRIETPFRCEVQRCDVK